jgi:hypothetical protein
MYTKMGVRGGGGREQEIKKCVERIPPIGYPRRSLDMSSFRIFLCNFNEQTK